MKRFRNRLLMTSALVLVGSSVGLAKDNNESLCQALQQQSGQVIADADIEAQSRQQLDALMNEVGDLRDEGRYGECVVRLREVQDVLESEGVDVTALRTIDKNPGFSDGTHVTTLEVEGGGEVVVEQEAPTVEVQQLEPEVTVKHQQPEVIVTQPQPEIIVRQPEPEVTVTVPQPVVTVVQAQPEIIVRIPEPIVQIRLPEPEVDVETQQPIVNVQQAEPRVTFVQPEPMVTVEQAEPTVNFQQADANINVVAASSADQNVQIEQEEPQVTFEQVGETEVEVDHEGEAQVNIEDAGEPDVTIEQAEADVQIEQGNAESLSAQDEDTLAAVKSEDGSSDADHWLSNHQLAGFDAVSLEGLDVYGAKGDVVGEIEAVAYHDEMLYLIVSEGGFLGIGDSEVPVPFKDLRVQGNKIVLKNISEDEFERMRDVDTDNYEVLDGRGTVRHLYENRRS